MYPKFRYRRVVSLITGYYHQSQLLSPSWIFLQKFRVAESEPTHHDAFLSGSDIEAGAGVAKHAWYVVKDGFGLCLVLEGLGVDIEEVALSDMDILGAKPTPLLSLDKYVYSIPHSRISFG